MCGHALPHGESLTDPGALLKRRPCPRRRGRWHAENIAQDPLAANHGRGARGIRSHRQNASLAQQPATCAVATERDAPEAAAAYVWDSVVPGQAFVDEC